MEAPFEWAQCRYHCMRSIQHHAHKLQSLLLHKRIRVLEKEIFFLKMAKQKSGGVIEKLVEVQSNYDIRVKVHGG